MHEQDKVNDLYDIAIKRYQNEKPDIRLSTQLKDAIWYSICGEINRNGEKSAEDYVNSAKL